MPLNVDPKLMEEMVRRELAKDSIRPKVSAPAPETKPLSPKMAMLLGGAADAASTYGFLQKEGHREGNPAFSYFNKKPWTVLPTSAAVGAGYLGLHKLLSKFSPKVADTAAGLLGGHQMALAGKNTQNVTNPSPGGGGSLNQVTNMFHNMNSKDR